MTTDHQTIQPAIRNGLSALFLTLRRYVEKEIELERVTRVGVLLVKSGAYKNNPVFNEIEKYCLRRQKADGGWIGVEDSIWSVAFLKQFDSYSVEYQHGLNWLKLQELESGGWGKVSRDSGRIPITGVLLFLLPELSNKENIEWIKKEWKRELCLKPQLTYKAAFYLMALRSTDCRFADSDLFGKTIAWLSSQQNEDSGWGPWKGHPVGSTPFCTGVALTGLLQYPDRVDRNAIIDGLKWIEKNQLEDGLWPDHYIEEGSAWSFYALTEGYKFLKERQ